MKLILAVLSDLYLFAADQLRGFWKSEPHSAPSSPALLTAAARLPELAPGATVHEAETVEAIPEEEITIPTFRSAADILHEAPVTGAPKNTVMYTGSERTPLFRQPTMEFDGAFSFIPYGAMVMVLEGRGRWSRVAYRNEDGWVLRDELSDRAAYVYPEFIVGEPNRAEDPNTLRVRAVIADEFGGGRAELPLQSSEYVLYRLYKKGVIPSWPKTRPRLDGLWHELLKGRDGVQIGVRACGGCIMEYTNEEGAGHLAYVEAVFPDETISISEANFPSDGVYNERVMLKEEWRELKPIFISIS